MYWQKQCLPRPKKKGISLPDPESYESIAGHGVRIVHNSKSYFLGNKHFIESPEHGNIIIPATIPLHNSSTMSSFYIGSEGLLLGTLPILDPIRSEARQTIHDLRQSGLHTIMMLSGDKQAITSAIAQTVGIANARGEVFPDQKHLIIKELQKDHQIVVMVGDGINDAPALKQADVGIAMGAMGMEPAIEAADIVLISNDLRKIVYMYQLSQKIFQVIRQNIIVGFILIHGIGITLTFLGFVNPLTAALFHAISDVAILINSARLINFKSSL